MAARKNKLDMFRSIRAYLGFLINVCFCLNTAPYFHLFENAPFEKKFFVETHVD